MPTPASIILAKATLPTHLSSAEIREQIAADVRARSLFSAKTAEAGYLERLKKLLADFAAGKINQAEFIMRAQQHLDGLGYNPATEGADAASLQDKSSEARIKLIIDTNIRQAQSVARSAATADPDIFDRWPAWKLARTGSRMVPRDDWWSRWHDAGQSVSWKGASKTRMVALKTSPIWAALGNGAGGYTDTLGTAYPPFAFSSGLSWLDVTDKEAKALGLTWQREDAPTATSLAPDSNEYQAAYDRLSPDLRAQVKTFLEDVA